MSLGNSIAGLFGQSPIKSLQSHYDTVHRGASTLADFFQAVIQDDWEAAAKYQQVIHRLENEADEKKRAFRLNMPSGLFLPIPRTNLLDMIDVQDRVVNRAKDIAGLMLGRKMRIPPTLADAFVAYVQRTIDTSAQAKATIDELDELIETGFGRRTAKLFEQMINQLDHIEHDTDGMQITIRAALYQLENELHPVNVMFLYQIIDWIGDLADRAQKVGGYLQMIVAR